jgi:hypothetical protein
MALIYFRTPHFGSSKVSNGTTSGVTTLPSVRSLDTLPASTEDHNELRRFGLQEFSTHATPYFPEVAYLMPHVLLRLTVMMNSDASVFESSRPTQHQFSPKWKIFYHMSSFMDSLYDFMTPAFVSPRTSTLQLF